MKHVEGNREIFLESLTQTAQYLLSELIANDFCPDCYIRNLVDIVLVTLVEEEKITVEDAQLLVKRLASHVCGGVAVLLVSEEEFVNLQQRTRSSLN